MSIQDAIALITILVFLAALHSAATGIAMLLFELVRKKPRTDDESNWCAGRVREKVESQAKCRVVRFGDDEAECAVLMDGYELPRVSFPASVLREKGLKAGDEFIWTIRDTPRIRLSDIDANVPQTDRLTEAEEEELSRLFKESAQHPNGSEESNESA